MTLAIFDLDNTLLAGDSDYLWSQHLVRRGVVDPEHHTREHDRFFREYLAGTIDIHEYLSFGLAPLRGQTMETLRQWRREFIHECITPIIPELTPRLLGEHRSRGHQIIIITATNRFVAEPVAEHLGVELLLATEPEIVEERFTGRTVGEPCFREGKLTHLQAWLERSGQTLAGAWFYSDSHNDLPLLEKVDNPVAVNPDPVLAETAHLRGWPVLLHDAPQADGRLQLFREDRPE
ncbi:MAG: HAD family phosphatase [Gammaproteobacteria bacterium]